VDKRPDRCLSGSRATHHRLFVYERLQPPNQALDGDWLFERRVSTMEEYLSAALELRDSGGVVIGRPAWREVEVGSSEVALTDQDDSPDQKLGVDLEG